MIASGIDITHHAGVHLERVHRDADVVAQRLRHLVVAVEAGQDRRRQGDLRIQTRVAHEVAADHQVEQLVGAAELDVRLHLDRVVRLHHEVEELVQVDGHAFLVALREVVALHEVGDGHLGGDLDELVERQRLEPGAVAHDLEPLLRQHARDLVDVRLRVRLDLVGRELRPGLLLAGRIADERREVADDEHRGVARVLELPELAEHDRVAQVDVGRARVDAQLHAERSALLELLQQLLLGVDVDGAPEEVLQLLARRFHF
jgi:hypothetical protein